MARSNETRTSGEDAGQKRKFDEMKNQLNLTKEKLKRTEEILDDVMALKYMRKEVKTSSAGKDGKVQLYYGVLLF